MAVIVRILVLIIGYALACVAASSVFTLGMLGARWDELIAEGFPQPAVWAIVAVGAFIICAVAFLPAMLIVVIAEAFAWRSVLLYGVFGGALALALSYGLDLSGYIGEPATYFSRERQLFAAAGIAGGLVYWLFAGRNAGAWKAAHE
jgi:hypothetical protein